MAASPTRPEAVPPTREDVITASNDIPIPFTNLPALYDWPVSDAEGYSINEVPSGTERCIKIVCVGAGASGINLAKFAQDRLKNIELVLYEKNSEVAGTWFESKYP